MDEPDTPVSTGVTPDPTTRRDEGGPPGSGDEAVASPIVDPAGLTLHTLLRHVRGVRPRVAEALESKGLPRVGHLVHYLPKRIGWEQGLSPIDTLLPEHDASVIGDIRSTRRAGGVFRGEGKPRLEWVLDDGTGPLEIVFYNPPRFLSSFHPGDRVEVRGTVKRWQGRLRMINPVIGRSARTPGDPDDARPHLRAEYEAAYEAGHREIAETIRVILPGALRHIDDHLPEDFRVERELPPLADAYRMVHAPASEAEFGEGMRRLSYDELLLMQLAVRMKSHALRHGRRAPVLPYSEDINRRIRARLPFSLTSAQDRVIGEIVGDVSGESPANRMIQGDVGCGKTVVAAYAMLLAAAGRHQSVMMVPTELLAEQHHRSLCQLLGGTEPRIELLTASLPKAERQAALGRIASGEAEVVVGTHALLAEDVRFRSLAMVIVDEQHRFGVQQRARLSSKGDASDTSGRPWWPHVLVMSATPIPRSMALLLHGDLDHSVIDEVPPGRPRVRTFWIREDQRTIYYERLARSLSAGEQAYIVVPAVEPGSDLRDVGTVVGELRAGPLAGHRIAGLHGSMPRAARDDVMDRFRAGAIDALVATTVIEVGVDVGNATSIFIEQADRYGLAQLHQLRGRVGRGTKPSRCVLIAEPSTDDARRRLEAMVQTRDGFRLAEIDTQIRGFGTIFDNRQSGSMRLHAADLDRDMDLLLMARRDAIAWIERSPRLDQPHEALLRHRIAKRIGGTHDLATVG